MIYTIDPNTQSFDPEALRIAYLNTDVIGINTAGNQIELVLKEGSTYDPMPVLEAHVVRDWKTINETKKQIAELEAQVTQRRLREATLGTDNGWLANLDTEIAALRGTL